MKAATPRHDFKPGTLLGKYADLLLSGKPFAQIIADDAPKNLKRPQTGVYLVRRKLIESGALKASAVPLGGKGRPLKAIAAAPVIQFHPETKAFKIHALISAGKTDAEILASTDYTKTDLYSVHSQIRKKIAAGVPGRAMILAEPKKLAKILKAKKANGHALAALVNGNGAAHGFSVPVVEAILHTPGGEPVRVFSSVDIFPQVYARAAKVTGFIP